MAELPPRCRSPAPWADIPVELAGLVLLRLRAHVDRVRFAVVCRHWSAAARQTPLPPPLPLLVLSDGTAGGLPDDGEPPFHLPRRCAGYSDASENWLVFTRDDGGYCCYLRNAFSVSREPCDRPCKELTVHKILYCSPHLVAALVDAFGKEIVRIAVCHPGANSWWSVHVGHRTPQFIDMVFHSGQLYAYDEYRNGLFAIDASVNQITGDPWVSGTRLAVHRNFCGPCTFVHCESETITMQSIYLVESCGELLMVCRTVHGMWKWKRFPSGLDKRITVVGTERNEFEVYKADFEEMQWTKVTAIGDDQVLFLRGRSSRSVCVSGHEMPGDSIIFMKNDDEDTDWYDEDIRSSCSVYSMKDTKGLSPSANGVLEAWCSVCYMALPLGVMTKVRLFVLLAKCMYLSDLGILVCSMTLSF
ncbi:unnamed protein product [Urochloa decumbens]|uniref:KIB1-4 beta-propeller domain-containing protein n=1 Tax=Urochloa decumbens TaxID=240449 RepID=A0ABC9ASN8_9POAL